MRFRALFNRIQYHSREELREPYLPRKSVDFFVEIQKLFKANVEEVTRPACWVEHPNTSQPLREICQFPLCPTERVDGLLPCLQTGLLGFSASICPYLIPFSSQGGHEHGLHYG